MFKPLENHIRSYRRKAGLSQTDLSLLLGHENRASVSRYERAERLPNLENVLALEITFNDPIQSIFPGVTERVTGEVRRRARALLEVLDDEPSPELAAKLEILSRLARPDDPSIIPLWEDE